MKPGTGGEMKQKTALQELRESYLAKYNEAMKLVRDNPNNGSQLDQRREERLRTKAGEYRAIVADIDKLLPTERKQIEEAYVRGWIECPAKSKTKISEESEMYFNDTYKTP